ncbi:MAG TPA: DUF2169 domain-containing protein [Polyangiales bacterium]|nr:DUF2169 domain-containing protein [Polyangiales bacterium]
MTEPRGSWFALNVVNGFAGGSIVGVIAKRTYRVAGGACWVADAQLALTEAPSATDDNVVLLQDMDTSLQRRQVDVIVHGKARVATPRTAFDVRLRVGTLDRVLRVFGERACSLSTWGKPLFSYAARVESVDLSWHNAYGGVDRVALAKHGDPLEQHYRELQEPYQAEFGAYAYPRNRAGKGYLIEATAEALAACHLPNLEEPADLLTPERLIVGHPQRWPLGPAVAAVGFLNYNYFPRSAMLALAPPFDSKHILPTDFFEVRMKVLRPESIADVMPIQNRLDLGCAQQSALGMRMAHVAPGERVEFTHVHPHFERWSFSLPNEYPSLLLKLPDQATTELEPKIRTLLFEPELDRLSIVWVGERAEAMPIGPGKREQIRCAVRWNGSAP